jgi:hypothetical protein
LTAGHAVLAKQGVQVTVSDLFGVGGKRLLDELQLDPAFHARVLSLRRLIDAFDFEVDVLAKRITAQLARHPGFKAIQAIDGVGPLLGMVFVAEIGDVTRFQVLELLVRNAGRVLTRSQIIDRVWGPQYVGDTRTLDVHVKRIRTKIEKDPAAPSHLLTVRGVGFRLQP